MAKYTTLVRSICESKSGLIESVGFSQIDNVLENAWDKIFTSRVEFFDESYRKILCKKILKHYYMREIGAETAGLWQLWVNTKLEEIMPYYNQLYNSTLLEFNPFYDVDLTTTKRGTNTENSTGSKTITTTENNKEVASKTNTGTVSDSRTSGSTTDNTNSGSVTDSGTTQRSNEGSSWDKFSDTPQGGINQINLNENAYLSNARNITSSGSDSESRNNTKNTTDTGKITFTGNDNNTETINTAENNTVDRTGSRNESNESSGTVNNLEEWLMTVKGKNGGSDYSTLLSKYRQTFLNIDLQVIEEFSDCFMLLW